MSYTGRSTRSGNSQAMAFEKALFRAHPEFASGRLVADCIGQGHLLIRTLPDTGETTPGDDPVLSAYLSFLQRELRAHPERIQPLSADSLARARALVGHIEVDPDEELGDGLTIE